MARLQPRSIIAKKVLMNTGPRRLIFIGEFSKRPFTGGAINAGGGPGLIPTGDTGTCGGRTPCPSSVLANIGNFYECPEPFPVRFVI